MLSSSSDWYIARPYWFVFRLNKNAILQYFVHYFKQKWIRAKFKKYFWKFKQNTFISKLMFCAKTLKRFPPFLRFCLLAVHSCALFAPLRLLTVHKAFTVRSQCVHNTLKNRSEFVNRLSFIRPYCHLLIRWGNFILENMKK